MAITENLFGAASYFRLPPDASGKRAQAFRHAHVEYSNGTQPIAVGDTVVGSVSGAEGQVSAIGPENTTSAGELAIVYGPSNAGADFAGGEQLQVGGQSVATVADAVDYYTPANTLVGANNPHNAQFVDRKGAAYIRFSEGEQQLDAFGLSRMSTPTLVGFYDFQYDELPDEFWDSTTGTGSVTYLPNEAAVAMDTGTADGDSVLRMTHKFHLYQPGFSQLALISMVVGDTGKANLVREWGYSCGGNGVFFRMRGSQLSVVLASTASGSLVEEEIVQSDWNGDRVDGSLGLNNLSGLALNVAARNVYWMDLQALRSGRARLGVLAPDGRRVVVHEFDNANTGTMPYLRTATLPLRFRQYNEGVVGSPSRMKLICAAVHTEGQLLPDRKKRTAKHSEETGTVTVGDTEIPLMSLQSRADLNGVTNRIMAVPELWSLHVSGAPIALRLYRNGVLTAPSWSMHDNASILVDTAASAMTNGHRLIAEYYDVGTHNVEAPQNFGTQGQHLRTYADGSPGDIWTFTAQSLEAGTPAAVRFAFTWIDVG